MNALIFIMVKEEGILMGASFPVEFFVCFNNRFVWVMRPGSFFLENFT